MRKEIAIYNMDELLTVVESINKALIGVEADVNVTFGAKDEEIKKIALQEGETYFKPTLDLPHAWTIVNLGKVEVTFRGVNLDRKFIN